MWREGRDAFVQPYSEKLNLLQSSIKYSGLFEVLKGIQSFHSRSTVLS